MRVALLALSVFVAVIVRPRDIEAVDAMRTRVTVRMYQTVGWTPEIERRALDRARRTLHAGYVDVRWMNCAPASGAPPAAACATPLGPRGLAIRIVRGEIPIARDGFTRLGDALVDPRTRTAVLATVYYERVAALAEFAEADVADLLGRAVAHELGHLLMASTTHAPNGLMRAKWTRAELRRGDDADWRFTPGDIAAMRRRSARD